LNQDSKIGDCRDENLVNELFGSVTDFAQIVEEYGDDFVRDGIVVEYNSKTGIHSFFRVDHLKY